MHGFTKILSALTLVAAAVCVSAAEHQTRKPVRITLNEAIITALENNRDLQIERINPLIMEAALGAAYGYYDPILFSDLRRESDVETGGFDPLNARAPDATYEANSTIGDVNLTGFLPSGMSYTINSSYAHSDGNRNSIDFDSYRLFAGITVRQPLLKNLWIDAGRYAIKINKKNLKQSDLLVRFIAMDVINRVQQAYSELIYSYESQRIAQQLVDARRGLLEGTRRKMQEGLATLPDEQLAAAQFAMAEITLRSSATTVEIAENMLRTHLGDSFTNQLNTRWEPADHSLLVPEQFNLGESWRRGIESRPDLAQLQVELEKADIDVRYRYNQLFPALDAIAAYGRRGSSTAEDVPPFTPKASLNEAMQQITSGEAPRDMIGIVLTVSLSRKTERNNYKTSKLLMEQWFLRLKQKEELVLREISDAFHTARTSYDRAITARQAVDAARAALQSEERRLTGGTSSIFFVLDLQSDLTQAQLAEARARADYNRAVAQWQFSEGSSLDRWSVKVGKDK